MDLIDRYELTIPGHMRLVDARSALNQLQRYIQGTASLDLSLLAEKLEPLVEALHEAADDAVPVNGQDSFMRQACEWDYIALSPRERDMLQQIRSCSEEGQQDIFRMVSQTLERKPMPEPQ